jgi:NitT/TauT family transport system permease protein
MTDNMQQEISETNSAALPPTSVRPQEKKSLKQRLYPIVLPFIVLSAALILWDLTVVWNDVPHYIFPRPFDVVLTLIKDWSMLSEALLNTLTITVLAIAVAVIGGVGLAILFAQSRIIEYSFFPFAVILQVTPVVAIAPLILIYVQNTIVALLVCAWIVAFFPVLSNTTFGLNSADHYLRDLFRLYGASNWKTLRYLRIPSALPHFLSGLRIAGGLALIGAIVAEFTAGTAGTGSGLAFRILEAGYRLHIARMFAALLLISGTGIAIFLALSWVQHMLLRKWHESAVKREH